MMSRAKTRRTRWPATGAIDYDTEPSKIATPKVQQVPAKIATPKVQQIQEAKLPQPQRGQREFSSIDRAPKGGSKEINKVRS